MLSWRRRVCELEEGVCAGGRKSLGAGPALGSVLSALARWLPPLGPDSGRIRFSLPRRRTLQLSKDEPRASVRYLGSATTVLGTDEGCAGAVGRIWASSGYGERSARLQLSVGRHGVRMGQSPELLFSLHRIAYCGADPLRPRILAWIYRHPLKNKAVALRCHAVLLAKPEAARALALTVQQSGAAALSEFRRRKRQDDRRSSAQMRMGRAVPTAPLRRRTLTGQYHTERPLTTLTAITEEEEEGEEEREEEKTKEEQKEKEKGKEKKGQEQEEEGKRREEEEKGEREKKGEEQREKEGELTGKKKKEKKEKEKEKEKEKGKAKEKEKEKGRVVRRLGAVWMSLSSLG